MQVQHKKTNYNLNSRFKGSMRVPVRGQTMTKFLNSVQILVTSDSNQIRCIFAEEPFVIENATIPCGIALAENLNGIQKFSQWTVFTQGVQTFG